MSALLWECVCWGALGLGLGAMWHGRRTYNLAIAMLDDANDVYQASLTMRREVRDLLSEAVDSGGPAR